jgi:hypothetical protein
MRAALLVLLLAGCAGACPSGPVPSWLVPAWPSVPTIPAQNLACLSNDTYAALVVRDRAWLDYARQCRAIFDTRSSP